MKDDCKICSMVRTAKICRVQICKVVLWLFAIIYAKYFEYFKISDALRDHLGQVRDVNFELSRLLIIVNCTMKPEYIFCPTLNLKQHISYFTLMTKECVYDLYVNILFVHKPFK